MRVGFDVDALCWPARTGLFNHAAGLVDGLRAAGLAGSSELYAYGRDVPAALNPAAAPHLGGLRVRRYVRPRRLWKLRMRFGRYGRLDVFQTLTCGSFPPRPGRLNAYLVPDLSTVHLPDAHTPENRAVWAGTLALVRAHADLVVTWSEHTRADVVATLGFPADRVAAVPLGCDPAFRSVSEADARPHLAKLGVEWGRYVLSVGTIEPRKNHAALFRAYAALKARGLVAGVPLVVVGGKGWGYEPVLAEVDRLGLADDVRLAGFVESLPAVYSGAAVMAYPSRFEGFGLPPLEAMACGCPVVAADATSLPEVVGDAGLLVPPDDVDGLAAAVGRVLAEPELRADLRAKGLARAAGFTWAKYAEGLFAAYRRMLS